MNLKTILETKVAPEETGMITDLKEAGAPASGLERIAGVITAMASKLLELLVPLYGSDSEEGKRLLRAIRTLQPLTKGTKAEDIVAVLKVLEGIVTPTTAVPTAEISKLAMRTPFATETTTGVPTIPATPGTETEGATLEELLRG